MKVFVAVDIGCIECGEDSGVIGIFKTEAAAQQAIQEYVNPDAPWGKEGRVGQHSEEIFEAEVPE